MIIRLRQAQTDSFYGTTAGTTPIACQTELVEGGAKGKELAT